MLPQGIFMGIVEETPENTSVPNVGATEARLVMEVNPLQPEKAFVPMLVMELPMVTEVNPLQP